MNKYMLQLNNEAARKAAHRYVDLAHDGDVFIIKEPNRTLEQNSMLWPLLTDISEQVEWYGNKLSSEEWKDVLTAALRKEKVVPGINGGFVVLGQRTSKMNKAEFSELLELILAFGSERGVKFAQNQA